VQNNCYDILGVDRDASQREIKAAFRRLAKKWHPDINPNIPRQNEQFTRIHQAYKILSHPEERARHDAALRAQTDKSRPSGNSSSRPTPREKEPPKAKPRPRSQVRPPVPPSPWDNLSAQFALFLKRVKDLFKFAEQGPPVPRGSPPSRPSKTAPSGGYQARPPSFERVFQTVWAQGITGFVLCSDGVIRRVDGKASPPDEKIRSGPGAAPRHAWRVGVGMLLFLLLKWHQISR